MENRSAGEKSIRVGLVEARAGCLRVAHGGLPVATRQCRLAAGAAGIPHARYESNFHHVPSLFRWHPRTSTVLNDFADFFQRNIDAYQNDDVENLRSRVKIDKLYNHRTKTEEAFKKALASERDVGNVRFGSGLVIREGRSYDCALAKVYPGRFVNYVSVLASAQIN